jgi:hypothetical protein
MLVVRVPLGSFSDINTGEGIAKAISIISNSFEKYIVANVIASSIVVVDDMGDSIDKDIATKLFINPPQILKKSRDFGALRQIIEDEDLLIILSTLKLETYCQHYLSVAK